MSVAARLKAFQSKPAVAPVAEAQASPPTSKEVVETLEAIVEAAVPILPKKSPPGRPFVEPDLSKMRSVVLPATPVGFTEPEEEESEEEEDVPKKRPPPLGKSATEERCDRLEAHLTRLEARIVQLEKEKKHLEEHVQAFAVGIREEHNAMSDHLTGGPSAEDQRRDHAALTYLEEQVTVLAEANERADAWSRALHRWAYAK